MADDATNPYNSINDLSSVSDLKKWFERLHQARSLRERQWRLNLAWYKGRQYTYTNRYTHRVEALPTEDGDKPNYIIRLVANKILPNSQNLLSRLTKTKPQMTCVPGSADDQALKAAQMGEKVLEGKWDDLELDDKLQEALLWSIICSQGYWHICWDKQAGTPMKFLLNPQTGQPITNESLKEQFTANLQQRGIDPAQFTKTVYMGDVKVEVLSPFDVYYDPAARTSSEAKWVICRRPMDPDEIYSRWGKRVQPDAVPVSPDSGIGANSGQGGNREDKKSLKMVYFMYVLPSAISPKGRYVVWVDEEGEKPLEDTAWPKGYPKKLPVVKFPGLRVPGDVYDSSVVEHAIPLQKELNRTISQIVEYKNLTVRPQLIAPVGSLRTRLTNEPGVVNEYMPIAGFKPEPLQHPNLPAYIFEHLQNILARLDDVFFQNEVAQGSLPPNVEASTSIDLLQEMATDRLAPWVKLMEKSIAQAGQLVLCLCQAYYDEPRLLAIKGSGGTVQVKQFSKADIEGDITVKVETGSGLPRTRAGRQALILELIRMQVIPPDRAYKYLEFGDMEALGQQMAADEDQALREHERILDGGVINEVALQQAQQQLEQTGGQMNPQTGQPFQSPDEIQEFLEHAAFGPTDFEDYKTHLDVHSLYMKSPDFEQLDPGLQRLFVMHYSATLQKMMSIPRQPDKINSPNVNLQIKATTGPTGAAAILNKAGVMDVTPQTMMEPPLETWNTDSPKDDPDWVAANNPIAMQHMEMLQQAQQMAQAQEQHDQQLGHQSAQHEQSMAHADQKQQLAAQLAKQKAAQSGKKPGGK